MRVLQGRFRELRSFEGMSNLHEEELEQLIMRVSVSEDSQKTVVSTQ